MHWVGTEREFKRAIQLNPNYAWAHYEYAGDYLILVGRTQEAIEEMKRARELDPLTVDINQALGWTFYIARQYDKAIERGLRVSAYDLRHEGQEQIVGEGNEQSPNRLGQDHRSHE